MKKFLSLLLLLLCATATFAQTQKGIVRTPGRENKKSLTVSNVLVRLVGAHNEAKSGKDGSFTLSIGDQGQTFQIGSVRKSGYTIFDKNITFPKVYPVSNVPIEIVMIKTEDLEREKEDWESRGYANAEKVYKKKLDALQKQYKSLKITEQEHNARLRELEEWYTRYQGLIGGMADFYVHVDFDKLDDGLKEITKAIAEGEYMVADSLINVYVPDLEKEVEQSIKDREAIHERRTFGESIVASAIADSLELAKRNERTESFLYAKYTTSVSDNRWDDALHYLKLRADLDTANVKAVWEYARLCHIQQNFKDSEKYYLIRLNADISQNDTGRIAETLNALGLLYLDLHDYINSEMYLKSALKYYEQLFFFNPNIYYHRCMANTEMNLGNLYINIHDYANSERYLELALSNQMQWYHQKPEYSAELANTQNTLGSLYYNLQDYTNCEKYLKLASENYEKLSEQNPDAYREFLAGTQVNLGSLYINLHDYTTSEKYFKSALENYEKLFDQNPDAYRKYIAATHMDLGNLYLNLHDYTSSENYYKSALEKRELLFKQNSDAYREDLATTQMNLGNLYFILHDYTSSENYYKLALENYERFHDQNLDTHIVILAQTHKYMMSLYEELENTELYDYHLQKAWEQYVKLFGSQHDLYKDTIIELRNKKAFSELKKGKYDEAMQLVEDTFLLDESDEKAILCLAICYLHKTYEYAKASDFTNAMKYIDKALLLDPSVPNFYDSKGEILLMQGRNDEALTMWKKVLELNPNFLDDYPEGTNLSNGLKKLGLIE